MENIEKSIREEVIETVVKLFNYTDSRNWQGIEDEVFTPKVMFDMSSLGAGAPGEMDATEICKNWEQGFQGIDSVHHQAGNFVVTLNGTNAGVFCYAVAFHYKKDATQGTTREFVGSYNVQLNQTAHGWRINSFQYVIKFVKGNTELV
jgi:hypothetical protein